MANLAIRLNKVFDILLGIVFSLNAGVLAADYVMRNSSSTTIADILTLLFIIASVSAACVSLYLLVHVKRRIKGINKSTWLLLVMVLILIIATFPIESWIASQSYRYGG